MTGADDPQVVIDRLARIRARSLCGNGVAHEYDDLVQEGRLAGWLALARFDPARGVQLATFLQHRIHGAMIDFIRAGDVRARRETKRIPAATLQPTRSLDEPVRGLDGAPVPLGETIPAEGDAVTELLDAAENAWLHRVAMNAVAGYKRRNVANNKRDRAIYLLHYGPEAMTHAAIGERYGIHTSRVCQIVGDVHREVTYRIRRAQAGEEA